MQLPELKLVTASNIINLRTKAGLTQAQLGEKLNYSDKSISKWERGEAIPDAYVLLQMAEMFDVNVDYILSSHDKWQPPPEENIDDGPSYSASVIIAIAVLGVLTVALAIFITLWIIGIIEWRIFLIAAAVAILTFLVLDCVFHHARHLMASVIALEMSLLLVLYSFLSGKNPWQIFLLIIPAVIITVLCFKIRKKPAS